MFRESKRLFKSSNKRFKEIIFFVHFFEGSPGALRKQIQLVNQLGFDAYAFQLSAWSKLYTKPFTSELGFGLKHIYTEEIEAHLNSLPGTKIIFSFSNPSASAIEAIARRHASDVRALICDSGPSFQMRQSGENLLRWNKNYPWLIAKILNPAFSFLWSPFFHKDTLKHLSLLPAGFPVMTLLSEDDLLIPPDDTRSGFQKQKHLNWTSVLLPKAGHLLGIKNNPDLYKSSVQEFLENLK